MADAKPFPLTPEHCIKVLIDKVCYTEIPITDKELKRMQQLVIVMADAMPFPLTPEHRMKVLIDKVCNAEIPIADEELKRMQQLVIGEIGCTSEEIKAPQNQEPLFFFNFLLRKGLLTRFNLAYFQFLLVQVNREDLAKIVETYGRESQNDAIYLLTPTDTTEENSKLYRIHIKDNNHANFGQMDQLLMNIGNCFGVPPEQVRVTGVQETDSLLLTLVIPAKYCQELTGSDALQALGKLDIDEVEIDGEKFLIEG